MCAENDHLPVRSVVNDWLAHDRVFSDQVADARAKGSHALIEETRDIADDGSNDWMEKHNRDGSFAGYTINGEAVQRSKLRIEQRWREAEAILPKVYGRKTQVEHSGSIEIAESHDDALIQELLDMLATGRLKLPNGIELMADDGEDEDDLAGPLRTVALADYDDLADDEPLDDLT